MLDHGTKPSISPTVRPDGSALGVENGSAAPAATWKSKYEKLGRRVAQGLRPAQPGQSRDIPSYSAASEPSPHDELLRSLYIQALPALIIDLAVLVGIVVLFIGTGAPDKLILPWALGVVMAAAARYVMTKRFLLEPEASERSSIWRSGYIITVVAYAAIWGLAGIYFVAPWSNPSIIIVVFLLCGLGTGAVVLYSAHIPMMLLVLAALILPFSIHLSLMPGEASQLALAATVAWATLASIGGWRSHVQLRHRVDSQLQAMHFAQERDVARLQAERRSYAKSEFLARMNHELRTPLNAVIGYTDMIRQKTLGPLGNPAYEEYVDIIHASADHLGHLVLELLELAEIEEGSLTLRKEDNVDITDVIAEAVNIVRPSADSSNLDIMCHLQSTAPRLSLDPTRIRQVLINVLTNAVKYSPSGRDVTIVLEADQDGFATVSVIDQGCGIPAAQISRVFEPFEQLEQDPESKDQGMGLGLAIAKKIVDAHDGHISIESTPPVGTKVKIALPLSHTVGANGPDWDTSVQDTLTKVEAPAG